MNETTSTVSAGRPPKFREASKPITVTLPERILKVMECVSRDRAKAIVKCVEAVTGSGTHALKAVELIEVIPGKALIVVGPSRLLQEISWLRLAEIAPGRSLLILPSGTGVEVLEVELLDLIDKLGPEEEGERRLLLELRALLVRQRQQKTVSKAELIFIDVPAKR